MKIQVVIEATSIEEYTEAIQALAAGYTVQAPVVNNVVVENKVPVGARQSVETDMIKGTPVVAEEKPKKVRKAVEKSKEDTSVPKTEEETSTPEQTETEVSFVDVKLKAKQLANTPDGKEDIKFTLDQLGVKKLSDLKEDQYKAFMDRAEEYLENVKISKQFSEDLDKEKSTKEVVKDLEKVGSELEQKEITLEMIRGKAKQLSVEGFKDEIKAELMKVGAASLTKLAKKDYNSFYEALVAING